MKAEEIAKARLWCLDDDEWSIELQFNPEARSLELSRHVDWSAVGNGYDPWGGPLEYDKGNPDTLRFSILFDQTAVGEPDLADATGLEKALLKALGSLLGEDPNTESVLPDLQKLYRLTVPVQPDASKYDVRPPIVAFVWEELEFMGAVTEVDVDFLLVDAEGRPKRARATVRMKGRAFTGATDLAGFLSADYTAPKVSSAARRSGPTRTDVLNLLK